MIDELIGFFPIFVLGQEIGIEIGFRLGDHLLEIEPTFLFWSQENRMIRIIVIGCFNEIHENDPHKQIYQDDIRDEKTGHIEIRDQRHTVFNGSLRFHKEKMKIWIFFISKSK